MANIPPTNDPTSREGTDWNDRFAFQVWMIFFLLTLCMALLNYLISYLRG